jgi:hypothetical protein
VLESCKNIRKKRLLVRRATKLCLVRQNKPRRITGSGNRMIIKGGKLNTKYKITVPRMAIDANNIYRKQVQLLVRVLPLVDTESVLL